MASSMSEERASRILGVSPGCTADELRSAYRAAVREASPGEKSEREKFQEISAAYTLLSSATSSPGGREQSSNSSSPQRRGQHPTFDGAFGATGTIDFSPGTGTEAGGSVSGSATTGGSRGDSSGKKRKKKRSAAAAAAASASAGSSSSGPILLPPPSSSGGGGGASATPQDVATGWSSSHHREILSRHHCSLEDVGSILGAAAGAAAAVATVQKEREEAGGGGSSSPSRSKRNGSKASTSGGSSPVRFGPAVPPGTASGATATAILEGLDLTSGSGGLDATAAAAAAAAMGFGENGGMGGPGGGASSTAKCSEAEMKALMSMFMEFMGMFSTSGSGGSEGNNSPSSPPKSPSAAAAAGSFAVPPEVAAAALGGGSMSAREFDTSFFQNLRVSMGGTTSSSSSSSPPPPPSSSSSPFSVPPAAAAAAGGAGGFPVFSMMFEGGGSTPSGSTAGSSAAASAGVTGDTFDRWVEYYNGGPPPDSVVDGGGGAGGRSGPSDDRCENRRRDDDGGVGDEGRRQQRQKQPQSQSQSQSSSPSSSSSSSTPTARMTIAAINKLRDAIRASNLHVSLQEKSFYRGSGGDSGDRGGGGGGPPSMSDSPGRGGGADRAGGKAKGASTASASSSAAADELLDENDDDADRDEAAAGRTAPGAPASVEVAGPESSSSSAPPATSSSSAADAVSAAEEPEEGEGAGTTNGGGGANFKSKKAERKRDKKARKREKERREAAERAAQAARKRREGRIVAWRSRVITACTSGEVTKLDALLSDSPFKKVAAARAAGGAATGHMAGRDDDSQSVASSSELNAAAEQQDEDDVLGHMEWLLRVCFPKNRKGLGRDEREARHRVAVFVMDTAFDAVLAGGKTGRSALHTACQIGDADFVRSAIQRGGGVAAVAEERKNSTRGRHHSAPPQSVQCRFEGQNDRDGHGSSSSFLDSLCQESGWSPLHYAVAGGSEEVLEELLAGGCNVSCLTDPSLTRKRSNGNGVSARELATLMVSGKHNSAIDCSGRALSEADSMLSDLPTRRLQRRVDRLLEVEECGYVPPSNGARNEETTQLEPKSDAAPEVAVVVPSTKPSSGSGTESKKKKKNRKKKNQTAPISSSVKDDGAAVQANAHEADESEEAADMLVGNDEADPLITALEAMGFTSEQIDAAVDACGGTERATADELVAWILERQCAANDTSDGGNADEGKANQPDDAPTEPVGPSVSQLQPQNQSEHLKRERMAASAAAKAKKEALAAAEREAALVAASRLAAKREEQRRKNREWNNREQMRQREEAQAKLAEEVERRRKAEIERARAEAARQAKGRIQHVPYPVSQNAPVHSMGRAAGHQPHGAYPTHSGGLHAIPGAPSHPNPAAPPYMPPDQPLRGNTQLHSPFPVDVPHMPSVTGGNAVHINSLHGASASQSFGHGQMESRMGVHNGAFQQHMMASNEVHMTNDVHMSMRPNNVDTSRSIPQSPDNAPVFVDTFGRPVENYAGHNQYPSASYPAHETVNDTAYYAEEEEPQHIEVNPLDFPELGKDSPGRVSSEVSDRDTGSVVAEGDEKTKSMMPTNSKFMDIPVDEEPNHMGVIRATAKAFVPRSASQGVVSATPTPPPGLDGASAGGLPGSASYNQPSFHGLNELGGTNAIEHSAGVPDPHPSALWAPINSGTAIASKATGGIGSSVDELPQSPLPPTASILASVSPSLATNTGDNIVIPPLHHSPVPSSASSLTGAGTDSVGFSFPMKKDAGGVPASLFESVSTGASEHAKSGDPFQSMGGSSIWGGTSSSSTGLGGLATLGFGQSAGSRRDSFSASGGDKKDGGGAVNINWGTDASNNNIW